MRRAAVIISALMLSGCAGLFAPDWSLYAPQINDQTQYAADVAWCKNKASAKPRNLVVVDVVSAAGSGAKQNVASPYIGAGIGVAGQAAETFGVTHNNIRSSFVDCVKRRSDKDGSAFVME